MSALSTKITCCSTSSAVDATGVRLDLDRIAQDAAGQPHDLGRHGRREEQRLALLRQRRDHFAHVVDEAHVEHAVGLVEDEHLEAIEPDQALAHQVEQAARRGDQDVDAARQRLHLLALADAAEDHGVAELEKVAVGGEAVADLRGQLARRGQHQDAAGLRPGRADVVRQALQDRQRERRRLAGAGLGAAQQVAAGEEMGNRLGLDRRRRGVVLGADGALDRRAQAEIGKGGHVTVAFWMAGAGQRRGSVQAIPRAAEAASQYIG